MRSSAVGAFLTKLSTEFRGRMGFASRQRLLTWRQAAAADHAMEAAGFRLAEGKGWPPPCSTTSRIGIRRSRVGRVHLHQLVAFPIKQVLGSDDMDGVGTTSSWPSGVSNSGRTFSPCTRTPPTQTLSIQGLGCWCLRSHIGRIGSSKPTAMPNGPSSWILLCTNSMMQVH